MKYVDDVIQERKPFLTSKVRPASTSDVIADVTFDSVGRDLHEVVMMLNDRFTDAGITIPDREVRRVAAFICGVPFDEAELTSAYEFGRAPA